MVIETSARFELLESREMFSAATSAHERHVAHLRHLRQAVAMPAAAPPFTRANASTPTGAAANTAEDPQIFVKIDGIDGASTLDAKHLKWIDCTSFSGGALTSYSSGSWPLRVASRTPVDFTFVKTIDQATPKIFEFASKGNNVATLTIDVVNPDYHTGTPIYEYKFFNVNLTSDQISASSTGSALETITFSYRAEDLVVNVFSRTGRVSATVRGHFDWDSGR